MLSLSPSRFTSFFKGEGNPKYTLVAGIGNTAKKFVRQLSAQRAHANKIMGFIDCSEDRECSVGKENVVGNIREIQQYLEVNPVDEIIIALNGLPSEAIQTILSAADYYGIRVKCILDYHEIFGNHYKITRYGEVEAINIRQLPLDGKYAALFKKGFDKVFSALVLILLFPLFLLLALLIKIQSPGPVFYCPIRIGKAGKPFKVYKFRSMHCNDDPSDGLLSTQQNDQRITRIGAILRKYNLDELPQFINVLMGNMSVVGPRPHRRFLNHQLQQSVYKYMVRQYVKPGITGWAQVNGWRGPTDTEEQRIQRTLHDLWYLENWSIWLDVKIVFLTIFSKKVLGGGFS